jgi:hypothetical protein
MPRPNSVISVVEEYHGKMWLDLLCKVDTKHPDYPKDGDMNDYFISSEEQSKLKGLLKGSKKNSFGIYEKKIDFKKVKYGPDEYGRYMSKGTTSLQSMWKFVRKVASVGKVKGFDIENSQPSILLQLCQKYAPDERFHFLEAYVNNRSSVKKEVAKYYGCSEDLAKTLIIILCFGGSPKTWKEKFGIQMDIDMPLIKGFHKDLKRIRTGCANSFDQFTIAKRVYKYKDDHGLLKEYSDLYRSALALYLQNIEGNIIMTMYKELPKLGCIPKTPIHDEICCKISDTVNTDDVICKLQAKVKEELGFDIKLKLDDYSLTGDDMKQIKAHEKFVKDNGCDDCDGGYNEIKALFEEEVFKIKYNAEFGIEKHGVFKGVLKKKDLDVAFTEWTYQVEEEEGIYKEEKFLKRWYDDKDKRMFDCIDFIPPPLVCSDSVYNLWRGFDISLMDVEAKDPAEILTLIWILSNKHTESYEYMLNWLAQMIQYPAKKPGTALVFKSKQGAGKGTLINIMRRVMGALVGETSNPQQDIFGSHGNIHIGKILVSLDEIKNGDTIKVLNRLKNLITSDKCIYNEKGLKQVEVNNATRFIFSTNESIPITLDGKDDRRYCLIECANDYCKNAQFWIDYYDNVVDDNGKIKGFFNYLMERDISGVNWMKFPETELRDEIIQVSTHPMVFWYDKFIHELIITRDKYTATKLFDSYRRFCTENGIAIVGNSKGFGIIFKDKIDFAACGITKTKSHGVMVYNIDRHKSFEWLQENDYSVYESLRVLNDVESDDDDEL